MTKRPEVKTSAKHPIPERHRKIGPLSRRFFQVYLGLISEVLEPFDLDPAFYSVLVELHDNPGVDQRRLGDALGIDRTTIGEMVDELERRRLLERKVAAEDRRARSLRLTKQGDALRLKIRPHMLAAQERFEAPLSASERPVFLDLLYRVVTGSLDHEQTGGFRRRKRKKAN
ncbi:MarR family winged helix-turn-helix transcriptional regulator [Reyranella sp.]|uniref:MarR family winged helix-turn-helix transcriptional regulator n=1 Tax=Reyranella sp. TaxID=1929291 RepID=UPI00272484F7|nr:MarR family winged helix-turn-helix transcriptional regulator [Reyranella sp.]MDO8974355.1 MarR family winged helix-turn-helix transcriptional regulator [Reyranella sp.]